MIDKGQQEISLFDLWQVLVKQKWLIFMTWGVCTLLGLVYVLLATPIYQAEAYMLPPSQKDVQALNVRLSSPSDKAGEKGRLITYSASDAYDLFIQTLESRANRRQFYESNKIANRLGMLASDDPDVFFEKGFNDNLLVTQGVQKNKKTNFVSLSFKGRDAVMAAKWVNDFMQITSIAVSRILAGDVQGQVNGAKANIKEAIEGKKLLAKIRKKDRIVALREAVYVRRSLNNQDLQLRSGVAINTEEFPLYMLSESALNAEINILQQRKDDSPFIEGLRDLEESLAALEQINIDATKIKPVFIDQEAFVPVRPTEPKKPLIMLLAGLLGLMLGGTAAFVRQVLRKQDGQIVDEK